MAELDDVYSDRLMQLAAEIPRSARLERPDATASARSKLCGSTITIDIRMEGDRFADFGQQVQACLLGQAAASVVGREIVGTHEDEFRAVAGAMRAMLKQRGSPPAGRWSDLALLAPVADYPHRHASTLLVFDAVEKALAELAERAGIAGAATR
ncbi:MAG: iron-sulfur cluster assembly scaffold protein [Hyphomicrobium sp.]